MAQSRNGDVPPEMNCEQWVERLRQLKGHYTPLMEASDVFSGRIEVERICGFEAVTIQMVGTGGAERTTKDVRRDGFDHYYAIFQIGGSSTITQRDEALKLSVGNVAIVDSSCPVTYISEHREGRWLSLVLPRNTMQSHLGFELQGLAQRRGETPAERLLLDLVSNAAGDDPSSEQSQTWMQLAVYDLLGALFAPADRADKTLRTDKLFKRICEMIESRFTDPDICAREIATEAGISLRYMQKLFTERETTFGHFVASRRLDLAESHIRRRALTRSDQPLSSIAYFCGYRDYTHFARAYRSRFGRAPSASSN